MAISRIADGTSIVWVIAAVVAAAAFAAADSACETSDARPFSGVRLNLFGIAWGKSSVEDGIRAWEARTGAQIHTSWVESTTELEREISSDLSTGANFYDAYICINQMVPTWASQGWLAGLSDAVAAKPELGWGDILPVFRDTMAVYGGEVVTIPWDGDIMLTYFRRDLAEKDGWTAPKTWDDFVDIAQRYDGQDLNEDGLPDYGACICSDQTDPNTLYHWITPMLTMVQSQGPQQGAFLNLTGKGVEPLVDNAAFRKMVEILKAAQGSYPMGSKTYGEAREDFAAGRCAIYFTWPSGGKWSIKTDAVGQPVYMHGRTGVANIPGSRQVLDWQTGQLINCTQELCPHAIDPATGANDGINRITWYASGGMSTILNAASTPGRQEAILDFLTWFAADLNTAGLSPYDPFRRNHLKVDDYIDSGWDEQDAAQYIAAELEALSLENAVLDFRVPFINEFFQSYNELYLHLLTGSPEMVEATITQIEHNVTSFINRFGKLISKPKLPGKLELERIYRESLGLEMRPIVAMCEPGQGYVETDAELGTGVCTPCPRGAYGPGGANQVCLSCTVGTASETEGSSVCEPCSAGTYAPAGSASCLPCPEGTAEGMMGQEVCPCDIGWWGLHGNCTRCPDGMTTRLLATVEVSECVCPAGTYRPADRTTPQNCISCGEGLDCEIGSDAMNFPGSVANVVTGQGPYPQVLPQYFTYTEAPLSVFKCVSKQACLGGPPQTCSAHSGGLACGLCEDGFFLVQGVDGSCKRCEDIYTSRILYPTSPFVLGPFVVFGLYWISRDDVEKWDSPTLGLAGAAALLLALMQSIAVVKATIDTGAMRYSGPSLMDSFNYFQHSVQLLSLFRPNCAINSNFSSRFVVKTSLPALSGIVVLFTFGISRISTKFMMDKNVTWSVYGGIFDMFYIAIAAQSLSLFQCYQHPNGKSSLRAAAEVLCYEGEWLELVAIAVIAVLAFCVFSLALYAYIICIAPTRIHEKSFRLKWKFILKRFRPACYGWSLVLLIKGLWINLAPVLSTSGAVVLILRFLGFLVYCAGTTLMAPWRRSEVSLLDAFVHCVILFVLCLLEFVIAVERRSDILDMGAMLLYFGLGICAIVGLRFVREVLKSGTGDAEAPTGNEKVIDELCQVPWLATADPELVRCVLRYSDQDITRGLQNFAFAASAISSMGENRSEAELRAAVEQDSTQRISSRVSTRVSTFSANTAAAVSLRLSTTGDSGADSVGRTGSDGSAGRPSVRAWRPPPQGTAASVDAGMVPRSSDSSAMRSLHTNSQDTSGTLNSSAAGGSLVSGTSSGQSAPGNRRMRHGSPSGARRPPTARGASPVNGGSGGGSGGASGVVVSGGSARESDAREGPLSGQGLDMGRGCGSLMAAVSSMPVGSAQGAGPDDFERGAISGAGGGLLLGREAAGEEKVKQAQSVEGEGSAEMHNASDRAFETGNVEFHKV